MSCVPKNKDTNTSKNFYKGISSLFVFLLLGIFSSTLWATPSVLGLYYEQWEADANREHDAELKEFRLINYFFTRMTATNQLADPSGLKGVSLGPLGIGNAGSATRVGNETQAFYIEQRWIPVIQYSPNFVDGLASFRAQFEIDYMWGRAANMIQNNQGGGLNADQVNIQTKNVNVAFYPTRKPSELSVLIGTQSFYDTIDDPTITSLFDLIKTGYKLAFLGTDGTGIAIFTRLIGLAKLSFIPFGSSQPDKASDNDPSFRYVFLATADYAYPIMPGTILGLSYWRLQDNTEGTAYAYEGLVRSGPSSTGLPVYTGTARFSIDRPSGHVNYIGFNANHNMHFNTGDLAASGFFMYNFGEYTSNKEDTQLNKSVSISGFAADIELMYNWGFTPKDLITLEFLYTSGDDDPTDSEYSGPFTMNYYGLPGAVWFNHKTLILFPFTSTVSNYTGAVTDISNQGFGLITAIGSASWDVIPNKLSLKIGAAFARCAVDPPPQTTGGPERGANIGAEINLELVYQIRYLLNIGLHVGYMFKGDFYDGSEQITANPWAGFLTLTWYAF